MKKDIIEIYNSLVNKLKAEGQEVSIRDVWNYCLMFRDDNIEFYHDAEDTLKKCFSSFSNYREIASQELIGLIAKKLNVPVEGNEQLIWDTFQNNFIRDGYSYHITGSYDAQNIKKVGLNVYEKGEIGEKLKEVCGSLKDRELVKNIFAKGSVDSNRFYYSRNLDISNASYGNVPEWFSFLIQRESNSVASPDFDQTKDNVKKEVLTLLKERNEEPKTIKLMEELIDLSWDNYLSDVRKIAVIIPNSELGIKPIDINVERDIKGKDAKEGLKFLMQHFVNATISGANCYTDKQVSPDKLMFLDAKDNTITKGQFRVITPEEARKGKEKIQKRKEDLLRRKCQYSERREPDDKYSIETLYYRIYSLLDGFSFHWKRLEEKGLIDEIVEQDLEIQKDKLQYDSELHGVNHTRRVNFFANAIMNALGDEVTDREKEIVFAIIKNHDIGRKNDRKDDRHGKFSTELLKEHPERLKGFSEEEKKIIMFAIEEHCYSKEQNETDLNRLIFGTDEKPDEIDEEKHEEYGKVKKILHIIEDADRLDRVRLDPEGLNRREGLDVNFLFYKESRMFEKLAYESHDKLLEMLYLVEEEKRLDSLFNSKKIEVPNVEKQGKEEGQK